MKNIKAIIFDCDGTLLDSERIYMGTWETVAKPMGYDVPMEILLDNRGKGKEYGRANLLRVMGDDFPLEEINRIREIANEEAFYAAENIVKPGVIELLDWMKENGILAAVASARSKKITSEHLQHGGLLEYFDVVVGGDMVKRNKPDPDSFLMAAKLLGVPASECLVIGDTKSDMKAAQVSGMKRAFVPDLINVDDEVIEMSSVVLQRIDEIISLMKGNI